MNSTKQSGSYDFASRVKSSDECTDMADVRAEVDRLDEILVALLAERQSYMVAAARIKADRAIIRDEARIQDVLDKVRARASTAGLDWRIAQPVWRALMEGCIAYEYEIYDALRNSRKASS